MTSWDDMEFEPLVECDVRPEELRVFDRVVECDVRPVMTVAVGERRADAVTHNVMSV